MLTEGAEGARVAAAGRSVLAGRAAWEVWGARVGARAVWVSETSPRPSPSGEGWGRGGSGGCLGSGLSSLGGFGQPERLIGLVNCGAQSNQGYQQRCPSGN